MKNKTRELKKVDNKRVKELEAEGLTHSDAIGVAMAEELKKKNEKN